MKDLIPALSATGLIGALIGVLVAQILNFFLQEKIHRKNRISREMCVSAMQFFSRTNYLIYLIKRVAENKHVYAFDKKIVKYSSKEKYWKEQDKVSSEMKMAYFELDFLYGDKCSTEYRLLFNDLFKLLHDSREIISHLSDEDFSMESNKNITKLKEIHQTCLVIHRKLKVHFQEDLHIETGNIDELTEETYH